MPHMYNHTDNNREIMTPTKKGMKKKETHKMPNGDIHTGAKHSKTSKIVKKAKKPKYEKNTTKNVAY